MLTKILFGSKKVEEIILKGMPLGAVKDFPYQIKTTELKSGDTLLLLSDGLPELFDSEKEMFGYDKVTKIRGRYVGIWLYPLAVKTMNYINVLC